MNRFLCIAMVLVGALYASAADRFAPDPEEISIATTGRILKIDLKNNTLRVRGSDGQNLSIRSVSQNFTQMVQGLTRINVTLPGGITIALLGRGKNTSRTSKEPSGNLDEY